MTKSHHRLVLAAIALFCFALLVYAYFLQHGPERQQPCPLCVLQRYVYFILGVVALIGAVWPRRSLMVSAALIATCGGGLALWQVMKGAEMTGCLRDPVGIFVNGLPMADWWPEYLFANGGCADKFYTLGLPVPVWSLLSFSALFCVLAWMALRTIKRT